MSYFIKKNNIIFTKKGDLTKIFEVYEGKIAVFAISNEQIHAHAELIEPVDVEIFAITRKIRDNQEFPAARPVADGIHL